MSTKLAQIVLAIKGSQTMDQLAASINERAGRQVISTPTLYGYTTRPRRPEPRQIGTLAKYMATTDHERAEILAAYLEDTLDATDIPPSERGLQIVLAIAESLPPTLAEDPAPYGTDRPDRERDLQTIRDHWHKDPDLQQLIHSLANMIAPNEAHQAEEIQKGHRLPTNDDTIPGAEESAG